MAAVAPSTLKELVSLVRAELGLDDKLAPKQVLAEVHAFLGAKPPAGVVGLRGEIEWAIGELLGEARALELGCGAAAPPARVPSPTEKTGGAPAGPPDEFVCPISCEIMEEPVTTLAGNTYEKASIMAWFRTHQTDPLTNARLYAFDPHFL
jgi:hypothetical protein